MPTVAICISGHLRSLEVGHDYLCRNIICANPDFDFDIYISTWEGVDAEKVKSLYNPVKLEIEPSKWWDASELLKANKVIVHPGSDGSSILSMFYKIKKCHELIDGRYDLVIRTRTDLLWDDPLPLNGFRDGKVYVPNGGTILPTSPNDKKVQNTEVLHSSYLVMKNWICSANDQFAVSTHDGMDFYAGTYDNVFNLVRLHSVFCPEAILYQHLIANGLTVVPITRASHLRRDDGRVIYFGPPI